MGHISFNGEQEKTNKPDSQITNPAVQIDMNKMELPNKTEPQSSEVSNNGTEYSGPPPKTKGDDFINDDLLNFFTPLDDSKKLAGDGDEKMAQRASESPATLSNDGDKSKEDSPQPSPEVQNAETGQLHQTELIEKFSESTIEKLPFVLKRPFVEKPMKKQQVDLTMITLLAICSGMLPEYFAVYNGARLSANLFFVGIAPFAQGKGYVRFLKKIINKTHSRKLKEYLEKIKEYNKLSKEEKKETPRPEEEGLLIPANNSKAGTLFKLAQNSGRGFIFETEIDTLVDALNKDYARFSDLLRCAFQNESYSAFTKGDKVNIYIEELFISMLLTGTEGQVYSLIPNEENGLFSRMAFFLLMIDTDFDDVFDDSKKDLEEYFDNYSIIFDEFYQRLENRIKPVYFAFQDHQKPEFLSFFSSLKQQLSNTVSDSFGGIVNRTAVIGLRIAMILSFYRTATLECIPDTILCEDIDFNNMLDIMRVLITHTIEVFNRIPKKTENSNSNNSTISAEDKEILVKRIKEMREEGLSFRAISEKLFKTENKHEKMRRWFNGL